MHASVFEKFSKYVCESDVGILGKSVNQSRGLHKMKAKIE